MTRVEVMGEIALERADAVFFHEGVKENGVWLPRSEIRISRNDPIPGIDTVSMPAAMAVEKGFFDEQSPV